MARWRPLHEYTPVARLMVDYMWEQRPPLLPSQFAARMDLPKQLVSSWLTGQATPSPAALLHLARRMEQPVSLLLVAAGYTRETDPLLDIPEAWTHVLTTVQQLRVQGSAGEQSEEETLQFQQLEALLQSAQAADLATWRAAVAAPEGAADRSFWSRRRRRVEPLEDANEEGTEVGTEEMEEASEEQMDEEEDEMETARS